HAHQVVDAAVDLVRLEELERLELALQLEEQEADQAEREGGREHAGNAGLPAVLLRLRARAAEALVEALEHVAALLVQVRALHERELRSPLRAHGAVGEDLRLDVAR